MLPTRISLTRKEAKAWLGCSENQLAKWIKEGLISPVNHKMFLVKDLVELMRQQADQCIGIRRRRMVNDKENGNGKKAQIRKVGGNPPCQDSRRATKEALGL